MDVEHDPQTAYITLLINNTNTLLSTNITDLILLDNITGLHVQKNSSDKTIDGIQIYRKRFLQGKTICREVPLFAHVEEHLFQSQDLFMNIYFFIFWWCEFSDYQIAQVQNSGKGFMLQFTVRLTHVFSPAFELLLISQAQKWPPVLCKSHCQQNETESFMVVFVHFGCF